MTHTHNATTAYTPPPADEAANAARSRLAYLADRERRLGRFFA